MCRKTVFLVVTVLGFFACNLFAVQINSSWVGSPGGDWETASNWSPAIVPENGANTFIVTIDGTSSWALVGLTQNHTITKLTCLGEVDLVRYDWYNMNLTIINGLSSKGDVSIDGLDITGNVSNETGGFLDFGEHMNIYGDLYNAAGAKMEVFPDDIDIEGGVVQNDGLIWANGGGNLGEANEFINNGQIEFFFDGGCMGETFDNNSTASIIGSGSITGGTLTNKGTIYASGGPFLCAFFDGTIENTGTLGNHTGGAMRVVTSGSDVNNQGTIEINAGGSTAFDCNIVNEPNGIIKLLGGILAATKITQKADANFAGFGGITADVVIEPNGIIQLTGPTNIVGDVNIAENATLEISDGQTLITGHTVCDGTIHLIGGTVIFQGGCDCEDCTIINEAGTDRNHFDINTDGIENMEDFAEFADDWLWQASWY
jgi:hypothetical protein